MTIKINEMVNRNSLLLCLVYLLIHSITFGKEAKIWKLSDIPVVYNIDSLEKKAQLLDKKSSDFLFHIICIEWSKLQIRSGKYGKYYNEIDSLSVIHKQPIGKAFTDYVTASSSLHPGHSVNHYLLSKAEDALRQFKINKDEFGIFFSNAMIARLYTSTVYQGNPNDSVDVQKDRKVELLKIKEHSHIADSIVQSSKDPFLWVFNNLNKAKTSTTIHIRDGQLGEAKSICEETIRYLNNSPSQSHYTSIAYFFYATVLSFQDSLEKSIFYEKKVLDNLLPFQSELKFTTLISIANKYNTLDDIDSSMYYCHEALVMVSENDLKNDYVLLNLYENLVSNFEAKKMFDSALFYSEQLKYTVFNYFTNQNKSEQKNFEFGLAFSLEKQKIEAQNRRNKQIILFSLIILLLLSGILFLILRARQKLNSAYLKIRDLQHSREKFYSIIAHDLMSPLDSYQGLANTISYLLKNKEYEQIEKISQKIDDNGFKIQSMLRNLFNWSLAEQQKLGYLPQPTNVNTFFEEITPLYKDIAESKHLEIFIDGDEEIIINIDKNYLATVVRNLLDNAIKYALFNSTVELKFYTNDNNFLLQIGNKANIDFEKVKLINDLFSNKKEWQPGEKGMGLGMILIKDFTTKMNGSVECNTENDSIIFKIRLPL